MPSQKKVSFSEERPVEKVKDISPKSTIRKKVPTLVNLDKRAQDLDKMIEEKCRLMINNQIEKDERQAELNKFYESRTEEFRAAYSQNTQDQEKYSHDKQILDQAIAHRYQLGQEQQFLEKIYKLVPTFIS
jgi:hypothetical protein